MKVEPLRPVDHASQAVALFLESLGVDLSDPHLQETPERVARMFRTELLAGYRTDVRGIFKTFEQHCENLVAINDIPFCSLCAHHLLPFFGTASIVYQANDRVVGLSKLARVVDCFARRLQVQERLTAEVADAIMEHLHPRGVAVRLRAVHLCMGMRGARKRGAETVTCAVRGVFESDGQAFARVSQILMRPPA